MQNSIHDYEKHSRMADRKILLGWGLGCLLSMTLIWGLVIAKIHFDRLELLDRAFKQVGSHANSYAEQVSETLEQIDQFSRIIKYQWERNADALDLQEQHRRGVYNNKIYPVVINSDGIVVAGTRILAKGKFMGDLDFFKVAKQDVSEKLLIFQGAGRGGLVGKSIIRLVRRLNKADGSFGGVVLIAIEPSFITSFQDESLLGKGDFISVRFVNGPLLANKTNGSGKSLTFFYKKNPFFSKNQGERFETSDKFLDNTARVVGWKILDDFPLVTVAAVSEKNVFISYEETTEKTYILIASGISLLLLIFTGLAAWVHVRNIGRKRHESEVQSIFRMAVDGAREAFYMIRLDHDLSGNVTDFMVEDCNERAAEMSGLARSTLMSNSLSELYESREFKKLYDFFSKTLAQGFYEDEFQVVEGKSHLPGWFQRRAVRSGVGIAVTVRDITESKKQSEALANMVRTDSLTGLPNRTWLNGYLPMALESAQLADQRVALFYIDLDNFKDINDTLGHGAGDDMLCEVAQVLRAQLRPQDHLARLGGDEFVVIIENINSETEAVNIAQKLIAALSTISTNLLGRIFTVNAAVGISLFPDDGMDIYSLLQSADIAMYVAKSEGRGNFRLYNENIGKKIKDRISMESELQLAIDNDQFVIHYQPRADAVTGKFSSMEALIRWQHPVHGLVSPLEFIGIAEKSLLIIPIGQLVIDKVCAQIAQWIEASLPVKPVTVNVSALQLHDDSLRNFMINCLQKHNLPANLIAIELTESTMLDKASVAPEELRKLRELGFQLQIDDFGTGYSSLSKLQSLDIDAVKIDQSFVREIAHNHQSKALCEAIVSIGRTLDIIVVAEGVETPDQLRILQEMGCKEMQGYLISRPVPAEEIPKLLIKDRFFEPFLSEGA